MYAEDFTAALEADKSRKGEDASLHGHGAASHAAGPLRPSSNLFASTTSLLDAFAGGWNPLCSSYAAWDGPSHITGPPSHELHAARAPLHVAPGLLASEPSTAARPDQLAASIAPSSSQPAPQPGQPRAGSRPASAGQETLAEASAPAAPSVAGPLEPVEVAGPSRVSPGRVGRSHAEEDATAQPLGGAALSLSLRSISASPSHSQLDKLDAPAAGRADEGSGGDGGGLGTVHSSLEWFPPETTASATAEAARGCSASDADAPEAAREQGSGRGAGAQAGPQRSGSDADDFGEDADAQLQELLRAFGQRDDGEPGCQPRGTALPAAVQPAARDAGGAQARRVGAGAAAVPAAGGSVASPADPQPRTRAGAASPSRVPLRSPVGGALPGRAPPSSAAAAAASASARRAAQRSASPGPALTVTAMAHGASAAPSAAARGLRSPSPFERQLMGESERRGTSAAQPVNPSAAPHRRGGASGGVQSPSGSGGSSRPGSTGRLPGSRPSTALVGGGLLDGAAAAALAWGAGGGGGGSMLAAPLGAPEAPGSAGAPMRYAELQRQQQQQQLLATATAKQALGQPRAEPGLQRYASPLSERGRAVPYPPAQPQPRLQPQPQLQAAHAARPQHAGSAAPAQLAGSGSGRSGRDGSKTSDGSAGGVGSGAGSARGSPDSDAAAAAGAPVALPRRRTGDSASDCGPSQPASAAASARAAAEPWRPINAAAAVKSSAYTDNNYTLNAAAAAAGAGGAASAGWRGGLPAGGPGVQGTSAPGLAAEASRPSSASSLASELADTGRRCENRRSGLFAVLCALPGPSGATGCSRCSQGWTIRIVLSLCYTLRMIRYRGGPC